MRSLLILALFAFFSGLPLRRGNGICAKEKKSASTIVVTIDDKTLGAGIPGDFLGLSYEMPSMTDTVYFRSNHSKYRNLIGNLGRGGVLRLNGYYGNFVQWSNHPRTPQMTKGNNYYLTDTVAASDLDTLFSFIRPTGWKIILGINTNKSTPALALSEVNYAMSNGKDVILGLELGNEPDGLFKSNYDDFRNAVVLPYYSFVRTSSPDAPVVGPASLHPDLFVKYFLRQDYDKVRFLTVHEYPVGDFPKVPENLSQLLDEKYAQRALDMDRAIDSMCREKHMRYRIDECNNFGDGGPNMSDRFAAALWGLNFMFDAAENNALGVNFHGGNVAFSPILIKKGAPPTAQALYYAMLFFHLAGSDKRLLSVSLNQKDPDIKVYATMGADHTVYVTLINKDITSDRTVQVACKSSYSRIGLTALTAPSVYSKDSISLAGSVVAADGRWQPKAPTAVTPVNGQAHVTVPRGSAILLTMKQ
jgi:hypothetical protein